MAVPFVRQYDSSRDFENGLHVFLTTIDQGLNWEPARTIGSYLWYKAYVALTPNTCFVLDDGTGRAVGYCIGTPDTKAFAQRWRDVFTPVLDPKLVPRPDLQTGDALLERPEIQGFRRAVYNGDCSMLQAWPQTLEQYPAHLHIDILPEFQRKGYGRHLIEAFLAKVKREGADGVHLDMVRHNTNGHAFYTRIGFTMCQQVLDGGASGFTGVNGIVMTLVKTL